MSSQEIIDTFWKTNLGTAKSNQKSPSVLPSNIYAQLVRDHVLKGDVGGRSVTASYEEAVKDCETKVALIVAECRRNNQKYSDPHFDLSDNECCLVPLSAEPEVSTAGNVSPSENVITYNVIKRGVSKGGLIKWDEPQFRKAEELVLVDLCVKRVGDIFDNPKFFVDGGARVKDTRQGGESDCWLISALGSLCVDEECPQLIERICPEKARDEKVGVYGFVFNRDGEWISEIIDDKLYLSVPDYDDCDYMERSIWERSHNRLDPAATREEYRKTFQRSSDALFHSSCAHPDETWVPLLEKAFAKAHGDYTAIGRGYTGEGVEDLTGGVTTQIRTANILDRDQLWEEGLLQVNKKFLFGVGTKVYKNSDLGGKDRQGIKDGHAYSVLKAATYRGTRLLLVKNPWGDSEWTGPWSDGSKEWTLDALKALEHTFGDDGIFWISYQDFLSRYALLHRTRLFSPNWNVSQRWTTIQVPWSGNYNDTKFEFVLSQPARTVIVISQLDDHYFQGLTGQYAFSLAFRLHHAGDSAHIIRGYSSGNRSATAELDLEPGTYEVFLQISGFRDANKPKIEDVVKQNWLSRREKLLRIGLSYDLAHAKGQMERSETAGAKAAKESRKASGKDATAAIPQRPTVAGNDAYRASIPIDADPTPQPFLNSAIPVDGEAAVGGSWNAACVVGLRVFCHETVATIRVVWPDAEDVTGDAKMRLDVDDPEKDAVDKVDENTTLGVFSEDHIGLEQLRDSAESEDHMR